MKLEGRGVVVTGASRGLGEALARAFARWGAKVVLVARDRERLGRIVDEIRREGGTAYPVQGDLGRKEDIYPLAGTASALAGPISVLVHNASALGPVPLRLLMDTDCEDVEQAFAVNVLGPLRLTKALAGNMALRGDGLVLSVTSDAAVEAYPTWGAYGLTKAALEHMTRTFAAELGDTGVRFIAVDPGEMDTRMHRDAMPDADPATLARPADVAERIVEWIASGAPGSGRVRVPDLSTAPLNGAAL